MILAVIFMLFPIGIYATLAALPQGRATWIGFALAAIILGLGWLSVTLGIGPLASGDTVNDGFLIAALGIYTGMAMAAGVAQIIRGILRPDRPGWLYPLIAVGILIVGGVPALTALGV